jgi:hypothetical protein
MIRKFMLCFSFMPMVHNLPDHLLVHAFFCDHFRAWLGTVFVYVHHVHVPFTPDCKVFVHVLRQYSSPTHFCVWVYVTKGIHLSKDKNQ